ncbi:glutathione-disulfide reductase [Haliea sp. AH-315-K21]|uniref:Glutathione-disulfide reductase n=1 Tax=SAR86 cluster bacterium TaxID=2030880 RepID=A0A2A5CF19_9GAMM|nr:glutathione-disulfide reductase [Haliea sp. AH-315-K21]MBN4075862.1 glutathione-disulfide reductase [Gammaproteobacteria bacterium AH-315-E17]PCJ42101.1 MAG: glutathione-disulfide reductase [SAR86 cluster bacterium]
MAKYDFFVIGAGSGGVRSARMAAGFGAKVAIVEDHYLGGTCVNVGCVPKKLYTYASHFRYDFEDSRGYGWSVQQPIFNWNTLRDNKKTEISRLNTIYRSMLENAGVEVLTGHARLLDANSVEIDGTAYQADKILLATGGWPFVPDFPGSEYAITSNEVFDLESFPKSILIVGGGYIAVEFAGVFAGLGAKTTLSYRRDLLLRHFDRDLREKFTTELERHVEVRLGSEIVEISENEGGVRTVKYADGTEDLYDCVLYATGRKPRTGNLGLENTQVALDSGGFIQINEDFQTAEASIYALGDVIGRVALTPVALAEGMNLARTLFANKPSTLDYSNIATAVFSHPNLATVGLTEETALSEGKQIEVYESDFRHLKHTVSGREERTYMKVIVEQESDQVLGMHMMGADAGEIIQGFAAAMRCGLTKEQLDNTIGIHPTAAEEFVTLRTKRA